MNTDVEPRSVLTYCAAVCGTCGWRHQRAAFRPGDRVRVLPHVEQAHPPDLFSPLSTRTLTHGGRYATVIEWSAFGGPVYVRVRFDDGQESGVWARHCENFHPCELEHA